MLNRDQVILVNEQDEWIGTADKMEVHRTGALHRALSIFIVNDAGEMLLQKRAAGKYHSGGLWTNACCSHPAPGESTLAAASRRLEEELGIRTPLTAVDTHLYKAAVTDELLEHEYDHIFTAHWNGEVCPEPAEVSEVRWINPEELSSWMRSEPAMFTSWFPILLQAWKSKQAGISQ